MKTFRNIYCRFVDEPSFFQGQTEISYTGEVIYDVYELPEGFDPEQDVYYQCSCELKEMKSFNKVQ